MSAWTIPTAHISEAAFQRRVLDLRFAIGGKPVTKARPRFTKNGKVYTPSSVKDYERTVGWLAKQAMGSATPNLHDDLGVEIVFRKANGQRSDIDNMVKTVLDGMNGIVWGDDQQVVELHARLHRHSETAGTDVRVYVVESRVRKCPTCDAILSPQHTAQGRTYCSKQCFDQQQRQGRVFACPTCGKAVWRDNEKTREGKGVHYCSPDCRAAVRGRCVVCDESMPWSPSTANKTCSSACSLAYQQQKAARSGSKYKCRSCAGPVALRGGRCRGCYFAERGFAPLPTTRVTCECGTELALGSLRVHLNRFRCGEGTPAEVHARLRDLAAKGGAR